MLESKKPDLHLRLKLKFIREMRSFFSKKYVKAQEVAPGVWQQIFTNGWEKDLKALPIVHAIAESSAH